MNIKLSAKKVVAVFLYHSCILRRPKSITNNRSIILTYHRILPERSRDISFIQPGMYVTVDTFEKHMDFLSRNFKLMSLEDLDDCLNSKNACMVTFDDGWADNYEHAFPILKKYQIPATIFLSTNLVGTHEWMWSDRIAYYIHMTPVRDFARIWNEILEKVGVECTIPVFEIEECQKIREWIIGCMKNMDTKMVLAVMEELDKAFPNQKDHLMKLRPWLTWDEVAEMKMEGISFGSHTHNHLILSRVPLPQAKEEIVLSYRVLSEKLGKPATMFSYPSGVFNHEITSMVAKSGYRMAVTTRRGFVNESSELFALNRTMLHNDMTSTIPLLACVLTNRIPFF